MQAFKLLLKSREWLCSVKNFCFLFHYLYFQASRPPSGHYFSPCLLPSIFRLFQHLFTECFYFFQRDSASIMWIFSEGLSDTCLGEFLISLSLPSAQIATIIFSQFRFLCSRIAICCQRAAIFLPGFQYLLGSQECLFQTKNKKKIFYHC